jgi:hypothetical protein
MLLHDHVKPFCCDVCEARFRQKVHLVAHRRVHESSRPFLCPCGEGYAARAGLLGHWSSGRCTHPGHELTGQALHKLGPGEIGTKELELTASNTSELVAPLQPTVSDFALLKQDGQDSGHFQSEESNLCSQEPSHKLDSPDLSSDDASAETAMPLDESAYEPFAHGLPTKPIEPAASPRPGVPGRGRQDSGQTAPAN